MNQVVSDASPLNYLILIGQADLLPRLFSRVVVPSHVREVEFNHPSTPPIVRAWTEDLPDWVEIRTPARIEEAGLHRGEAEAISLALGFECPVLLDDKPGRIAAQRKGLMIIGTLGILTRAARLGWIDLGVVLRKLQNTNIHLHPTLLRSVLADHEPPR
jgi:predicted nucleic acid-binding protein